MISYKQRVFRWSIFWTIFVALCVVAVIFVPIPSTRMDRIDDVSGGPYVIEQPDTTGFGLPKYLTRIKDAKPLAPLSYVQGWTFEIANAYHYYDLETAQYDLKRQGGHLVSLREMIKP